MWSEAKPEQKPVAYGGLGVGHEVGPGPVWADEVEDPEGTKMRILLVNNRLTWA